MPFDKYLEPNPPPSSLFSHAVEFEIPPFIHAQPSLVPGGGAEVLPYNPSSSAWLTTPPPLTNSISKHHVHTTTTTITAPSPLGLPLYSASGFDLLSILSRIPTRPNPRVALGPVDLTCSFVVVDTRKHDHPIVYCSPSFCALTGYPESHVLGRNCRFLQAPPACGPLRKGDARLFTDGEQVKGMKRMLERDRECQISIVNYKRDGSAFCNLITVIPVGGGESGEGRVDEVVWHVGFQVDLGEQPNAILRKLKDGSYTGIGVVPPTPTTTLVPAPTTVSTTTKKNTTIPPIAISKSLKKLLSSPSFLASFPITTPTPSLALSPSPDTNNPLSLLLLEYSPDFIHVVSLKGAFLYVAPSIRRVLGWDPQDLVGKSIADLAHPEDVVPLMRELKQGSVAAPFVSPFPSSSTSSSLSPSSTAPSSTTTPIPPHHPRPRLVDMLYRARTKSGTYVWLEARGRLHPEPGKGRKAIVLSGRARAMGTLRWGAVARAGMCEPVYLRVGDSKCGGGEGGKGDVGKEREGGGKDKEQEQEQEEGSLIKVIHREFWCVATPSSPTSSPASGGATFLSVGKGVRDVLGWEPHELVGRRVGALVSPSGVCSGGAGVGGGVVGGVVGGGGGTREVRCGMVRKDGGIADVAVVFYPPESADDTANDGKTTREKLGIAPAPLIVQIRLTTPTSSSAYSSSPSTQAQLSAPITLTHTLTPSHPPSASLWAEMEVAQGTSWQYELEKLRFANRRLEREVRRLEGILFAGAGAVAGGGEGVSGEGVSGEVREVGGEGGVQGDGVKEGEQRGEPGEMYNEQHAYEHPYHPQPQAQSQPQYQDAWSSYHDTYPHPHPQQQQQVYAPAPVPITAPIPMPFDSQVHTQALVVPSQGYVGYTVPHPDLQGQYSEYAHALGHGHGHGHGYGQGHGHGHGHGHGQGQEYLFEYEYTGVDQYVHHPHPHPQHLQHLQYQHSHSHQHQSKRPRPSTINLNDLPQPPLQAQFQSRMPIEQVYTPTPMQMQMQGWAQYPRGLKRAWAGYD